MSKITVFLPFDINGDMPQAKQDLGRIARYALRLELTKPLLNVAISALPEDMQNYTRTEFGRLKKERELNRKRSGTHVPKVRELKPPKPRAYKRVRVFTVDYIFENMGRTIEFADTHNPSAKYTLSVRSKRYRCYHKKGCVCVRCGFKGTFFAAEKSAGQITDKFHLNLYGLDEDGRERMMTVDHILPKSLGGEDKVSNYQPMCSHCNCRKGNEIQPEDKKILGIKDLAPSTECDTACDTACDTDMVEV